MIYFLSGREPLFEDHALILFLAGWGLLPENDRDAPPPSSLIERLEQTPEAIIVTRQDDKTTGNFVKFFPRGRSVHPRELPRRAAGSAITGSSAGSKRCRRRRELNGVRRYAIAAATVACFALGVAGVLRVVGWSNLSGGGVGGVRQPIAFDDYALQFYYGQLGSRFLAEGGVTYGYDPNFMAGYPKTPVYYPSSKPYEYSLAPLLRIRPRHRLQLHRVLDAGRAPLPDVRRGRELPFLGRRTSGRRGDERRPPPHGSRSAGFYGIMEAAGMVPYIFASFLSVYVVSLVHRFLDAGERRAALALLVAAPLLYLCHLTAVFISVVPIAAIYLTRASRDAPAPPRVDVAGPRGGGRGELVLDRGVPPLLALRGSRRVLHTGGK